MFKAEIKDIKKNKQYYTLNGRETTARENIIMRDVIIF